MLAVFVAMAWLTRWLHDTFGTRAAAVPRRSACSCVAWIAQFIGHKIEGRKPSFLTDLTYLLIGPAWVLAKLYRKLGWSLLTRLPERVDACSARRTCRLRSR